jgi:hypothetical protein
MDMKARTLLVIISLTLTLLIAGCGGSSDSGSPSSSTPFIGGKTGLLAEFIEGAPPDFTFDNAASPFSVVVKLENAGEDDVPVTDAFVKVVGINPDEFATTRAQLQKNIPNQLDGAKKTSEGDVIKGGQTTVEFTDLRYTPNIPGNAERTIRADVCYNYRTQAVTTVCVREELLDQQNRQSVCEVSGDKPVFNWGAPLHVTNVKENPLGADKIQLTFTVEHVGDVKDDFFSVSTAACDASLTNPERNRVFVTVLSDIRGVKGPQTTDKSEGFVRLFNKAPRLVTCSYDLSGVSGDFEDDVIIELHYKYLQSIQKSLLIKDVPQPR